MTITASDLGFRLEMLRVRGGGRLGVNWVRWGEQQEGTPPHGAQQQFSGWLIYTSPVPTSATD